MECLIIVYKDPVLYLSGAVYYNERDMTKPIPSELIENKIYCFRGLAVMLDSDLAALYEVETRRLKEQVKRNISRFPDDFMFVLSNQELEILRSQNATSSWGGSRYLPMAFTEQGVAMLSSVLNSERAINVNIQIMRSFSKLRKMLSSHEELKRKIESMEKQYDDKFRIVFEAIKQMLREDRHPKRKIGFLDVNR